MKVVFAGDLFMGGDLSHVDLIDCVKVPKFNNADCRIVNLEHPITDKKAIAEKSVLYTGSEVLQSLKRSNINAVCLANNHIHDKLNVGIEDTLTNLKNVGISYFGAGKNIHEASKPYWVSDSLGVLGYCQFNSPTLNDIQIATKNRPGVNPLTYEKIIQDLKSLPSNTKAILYFHWGREHVWLTERKNIGMAYKLLRNDKVAMIIGTHPHRIQGYLSLNSKRAYFSLGNFLFPNFYIKPQKEVLNSYIKKNNERILTTRQYHTVNKITYKKWRLVNRVSQLIEYDTESQQVNHFLLNQKDNTPIVNELKGIKKIIFLGIVKYLSTLYHLPNFIYVFWERVFSKYRVLIWKIQIKIFQIRENGFIWVFKKVVGRHE